MAKTIKRLTLITLLAGSSFATALGQGVPRDWVAIRAAGMGDAFTSVANDETAPFSNPAGIVRTHRPRSKYNLHILTFPGTAIGANEAGTRALRAAKGGAKERFGKLFDEASKDAAQPVFFEAQAFPAAVVATKRSPTYLIGFPSRSTLNLSIPDSTKPTTAVLKSVTTAGAAIAVGNMSPKGSFAYGLSARPNYRYTYVDNAFDTTTGSFDSLKGKITSSASKTTAVAFDAGVLITYPDYWLPTVGLSIKNIPLSCIKNYKNPVTLKEQTMCGTPRSGASGSTVNEDLLDPTEVRFGFSIIPRFRFGGSRANLRLSADAHPLPIKSGAINYGLADLYLNKILHAGVELSFGNAWQESAFALRAGAHQGFNTYGASINLIGFAIDYASYVEDIGTETAQRADRRHLLGVTTHW